MIVRDVPIAQIKVSDRFRKDVGDLEELAHSIEQKGLIQPITLDANLNLISGSRRLEAAKLAKLLLVPAVVRDFATELDAREVELFENIYRKDMTWQERANLEKRIFELKSKEDPKWALRRQAEVTDSSKSGVHRRLQLADALEIIPELASCKTEEDAWKKLKRIEESAVMSALANKSSEKVKQASKYAEDHYIIRDAFEGMAQLNNNVYHFAEVDPPYAVALDKRKARNSDPGTDRYTEVAPEEYPNFLRNMAELVYAKLRPNSFCVWWYGMTWHEQVRDTLRAVGFRVSDIPAIWYKGGAGQTASPDTMLGSVYEPFFVARKGEPKLRKPGRANVFEFQPLAPSRKIHPTERPLELMVEILETFTYPGSIVCVPFLGSGVTLRSCYKLGLTGFGYDLDEVTKKRFLAKVAEDALTKEEQEKASYGKKQKQEDAERHAKNRQELESYLQGYGKHNEGEAEDQGEEEDQEITLDEQDLADALEHDDAA